MSILPDLPTNFFIKKWISGILLPVGMSGYGLKSLFTAESHAIALGRYHLDFIPVSGFQAHLMGVGYLGFALALFGWCFAPYSERLHKTAIPIMVAGLVIGCIAVAWNSWMYFVNLAS